MRYQAQIWPSPDIHVHRGILFLLYSEMDPTHSTKLIQRMILEKKSTKYLTEQIIK